MGFVRNLIEHI